MSSDWTRIAKNIAAGTLALRIGVVGVNFAVMMGLATVLGLEVFGQLAFLWGATLVAGTVLSLGGPLIILQAVTNGGGMHRRQLMALAVVYPFAFAFLAYLALSGLWPAMPWTAILCAGLGVNLLGCVASLMRGLGSVQGSMALRDAGPQCTLAGAALIVGEPDATAILLVSASLMGILAGHCGLWCLTRASDGNAFSSDARSSWSPALWATSVFGMGVAQMDLIIGGAFLPAEALGLYALLRRIANLVALPVSVATWISAGPISAAFGAGDMRQLEQASAAGSRIAMLPGTALFALGLAGLPLMSWVVVPDQISAAVGLFVILLLGALGQVVVASSYTVATLCGFARYSVLARGATLLAYVTFALALGDGLSPLSNALCAICAITLGSFVLWALLKARLGLDTSAFILLRKPMPTWKTS